MAFWPIDTLLPETVRTFSSLSTLATQTNTVSIGAGQAFTVNGNVVIGPNVNNTTTRLVMSGSGSFIVNTNGGLFKVGGATANDTGNSAIRATFAPAPTG